MIVRPVQVDDVSLLQGRLREQDHDEVWAARGRDPDTMLSESVQASVLCWSIVVEEQVLGMFGVAPSKVAGEGQPWLLGADGLTKLSRQLIREPAGYIKQMHGKFPILRNVVDARNSISLRWISRVGFTLSSSPRPYGPFSMPFYEFYREDSQCAQLSGD